MGLKFTAKCLPEYFGRLKEFGVDYRQFDEITFINTKTGEEKTFKIDWISRLNDSEQEIVRDLTPEVPWDEERQIYAINLANEIKNKRGQKGSTKKT